MCLAAKTIFALDSSMLCLIVSMIPTGYAVLFVINSFSAEVEAYA